MGDQYDWNFTSVSLSPFQAGLNLVNVRTGRRVMVEEGQMAGFEKAIWGTATPEFAEGLEEIALEAAYEK